MKKKYNVKVKRKAYYCNTRQSWVLPITRGLETMIDEEDIAELEKYNWHQLSPTRKYAARREIGNNHIAILMHRQIMNAPSGMVIDHINGNSLDNRKSNLRICTHRQNQQNRYTHRAGRLVGATFKKGKWIAKITYDNKIKYLGRFKTEIEAHEAYINALKELAGT